MPCGKSPIIVLREGESMVRFSGVYVAVITTFEESSGEVDYRLLQKHVDWLVENGVHGLIPAGSVGEYASLRDDERGRVVETVAQAAAGRVPVVVGIAAPSTGEAVGWARHALEVSASGILALPPINYNPTRQEVIAHYKALSEVGLPIVAYNNPLDTKVDLTPDLLTELSQIENVLAVKEFSLDVRRISEILEATNLEVMAGSDDLAFESFLMGATGWVAGFPNAFPKQSVELFKLSEEGRFHEARELYQRLLPLFRWDSTPLLVQAIKHSLSVLGRPVGEVRTPRLPLEETDRFRVEDALAYAQDSQVEV